MTKHKRNRLGKAKVLTVTHLQARIMQTDADIFAAHYNVLEVIRPFVTGEFPNEFLEQYTDVEIQAFRWVHVIKMGEIPLSGEIAKKMGGTLGIQVRRIPLTQQQYEELVGHDVSQPPTDLSIGHLPFIVLKTTDESDQNSDKE